MSDGFCLFNDWRLECGFGECTFMVHLKSKTMTPQSPLQKLTYMVPFSSVTMDFMDKKRVYPRHLPLLNVTIDFEKGTLNLEGDWEYIMYLNGHSAQEWFVKSRERVQIAMNIRGLLALDLAEIDEDGLVLPLGGMLTDHFGAGNCSGMLVIDAVGMYSGAVNNDWDISIYLYDQQQSNLEFKVTVPLFTGATNFFEYAN